MRTVETLNFRNTLRTAALSSLAFLASGAAVAAPPRIAPPGADGPPARMLPASNQTPWIYINHYITNFAVDVTVAAYDPDGSVVALVLDFGDGTTASSGGAEIVRQHVYAAPGTYTLTVTAVDNSGGSSVGTRTVWISGSDST